MANEKTSLVVHQQLVQLCRYRFIHPKVLGHPRQDRFQGPRPMLALNSDPILATRSLTTNEISLNAGLHLPADPRTGRS